MVKAAAIYARISSDPEGDRLGVTRQREDCERLAAAKGWPVADTYTDDDRSAYSGKPRPEYRRLLDDIAAHAVDAVLVYNLDRLHRQPRELEAFFDIVDAAKLVNLASVEGDINLGSSDGRFQARIMGAMARKSSDDASRRIRRKLLQNALDGKPTGGGTRPFGYRPDRVSIDPPEAVLVREAATRILAGESVRAIAADWNERGIRTPKDRPWSVETMGRMLHSARLSGQREHHGEIVASGAWEPIITPEETARLRAILEERAGSGTRTVRKYLLPGLLRCGLCAATLVSRAAADGTKRYVCAKGPGFAGCGHLAINADPVERLITEAVLYRLDAPDLAAALAGAASADAATAAEQHALAQDRAQLEELATAYGNRLLTMPELLAARKPIEARIDAARKRLSRLSRSAAVDPFLGRSGELRAKWSTLPLTRQRSIVAAVLDRATIRPAVRGRSSFDPGRVEAVWRT
ncbi:MAG TPA: recombinase family protein [Candidatus Dormibacteraeota bacterium]|nr:recombinase family protein [Candidatus Dormibacteraeota bacterium]